MNAGMNAGMNTVVASTVVASTAAAWRAWLERNGRSEKEVWLVVHHKDSGTPSVRYHEAIEHALCYGWIDGLHRTRDADSSQLRFTPRRPRSTWSRVNRLRAATMIERGLMTDPGQATIDLARVGGTWAVPGDEEGSVLPDDLREPLDGHPRGGEPQGQPSIDPRRVLRDGPAVVSGVWCQNTTRHSRVGWR